MRRTGSALLLALASCVTPSHPAETDELRPVPRSAAEAEAAARPAPNVLPAAAAAGVDAVLAAIRERGRATLADAFRVAEATNEDLLSGDEDRLQAALRRDLALAGIQPTVALSAFALVQDRVPATMSASGPGSSSSNSGDREQWAVTVRQPIFRGFAEFNAMRAADRSAESRAAFVEAMRAALRRSVARAFFGVLLAEAEVRTLQDSDQLDRARIDEMRARQENGIARRTEVLLLESQHARTLSELQRAQASRGVGEAVLAQLLGAELGVPLDGGGDAAGDVPGHAVAVAEALRSRHEFRASTLASESAEALADVARSGYWPTVSLQGNWYLGRAGVSEFTKSTDWDALVTFDFPLFEGGATRSRERTAKSEVRKARLAESATLRSVVADVESVLARVAADDALLVNLERNSELARENLALLREEYAHGIATNLEVLTVQNVLQSARLDVERQRLARRLGRVELALALGRTEIER